MIRKKVHYHADHYALMRKGIVPHGYHIDASNVGVLEELNFVFLCVDRGNVKLHIVEKLEALGISFIDVGMGIEPVDDQLLGILRVTTSTATKRDHVRDKKRIGFSSDDVDEVYSKNIQIAELNALNAALAVIRWKKLLGFYKDFEQEHYSTYTLDGNLILNDDRA